MSWISANHVFLAAAVSILGAVVSLSGAAVSFWFTSKKDRRDQFDLQMKYFENVRKWADTAADALTEAIFLCDLDPTKVKGDDFFERRHRLRASISNSIDKGRWFFPNIQTDHHGAEKQKGFRGYRHGTLDGLVEAYSALNAMSYTEKAKNLNVREHLISAKKRFVGEIQGVLDPAGQREEFFRIVQHGTSPRKSEPSVMR